MDLEHKRLYHWLPWALSLGVLGLFIFLLRNSLVNQEEYQQQQFVSEQEALHISEKEAQSELAAQSRYLANALVQDRNIIELIRQSHRAFEANNRNVFAEQVVALREKLNAQLQPYWNTMKILGVRECNIHFGPNALVFLRVNKVDRFGDDINAISAMTADSFREGKENDGMEVGRNGSAYRALVPIFRADDQHTSPIALIEIGVSLLSNKYPNNDFGKAVFLHPSIVNDVLWETTRTEIKANVGVARGKWGVEEYTSPIIKTWQTKGFLPDNFAHNDHPLLLQDNGKKYLLMATPVVDFSGRNAAGAASKVFVVYWRDVTAEIAQHELALKNTKIKYILAWFLTQVFLLILLYFNRNHVLKLLREHSQQIKKERDQSEQSRQRLALALSSSESGFWEWDIASNKAKFSQEWRDLCGLSSDEHGRADIEEWLSRVHPSDKRTSYTEMIRHVKGETPMFENEYRLQIADGSYKWIFTRGKVVEWQSDGRASLMLGVYTDVTERKKNEIIVIRQQAALHALNEIATLPVVDAEDQLRRALEVGSRYFGLPSGCISRINGHAYEIRVKIPAPATFAANKIHALSDYFCDETYHAADVFAVDEISTTEFSHYSARLKLGCESYIGAPVWVAGKIYGTLSFTSDQSRHQAYDELDKDFMRLFARWVGATLEQWQFQYEQQGLIGRFEKLSESLPGFLYQFQINADGQSFFPYSSSGIEDIYGVKPDDVLISAGKVFTVIHPDDLGWIGESISASAANLTIWSATYRVRHPRRGEIWVRGESRPERLPDGGTRWHGFIHDVTEEKQAVIKLQETNTLREAIFDAASISIISTDIHGTIKTFNRGAETMLGYAADEIINRINPGVFHLPPEVVAYTEKINNEFGWCIEPSFETFVAKAREDTVDENEWTYVRKDGSHVAVLLTVSALRDPNGAITGYLGLARDISELKRIDKMKAEFISTVSHELRTPLTAISGALGIIMGGAVGSIPDAATKMLNIAHKNSLRLIHLVNDLLDMEKLVAGKMHFDMQSQPLLPILYQSIDANTAYAEALNVKIELKSTLLKGDRVVVDAQRLQQVLANFLSNAAKFSPANEVVILNAEKNFNSIRVSVIDKGAGIPGSFRSRIFQKFSQADSSDTRQKGGTGLGLSICKEIIERMNGKIGFESVEGSGAEFYFEIPCEESAAYTSERQELKGPTGSRILIVEDDHEVADVLAIMLRNANYRVDIAYSGQAAMERLALYNYELITIDLHLPDTDGISLIRQIRSDSMTQAIPVVVISALLDEARHAVKNDRVFNEVGWIEKPLEEMDLLSTIKKLFDKKTSAEASI